MSRSYDPPFDDQYDGQYDGRYDGPYDGHDAPAAPAAAPAPLPAGAVGLSAADVGAAGHVVDLATYYRARLWHSFNAAHIFMEASFALDGGGPAALAVDEAIARDYWDLHGGVLLPPRVMRLLRDAAQGQGGAGLLRRAEEWVEAVGRAPGGYDDAKRLYGAARADLLAAGVAGELTPRHVAVGEFLADLLVLQRAIAADVRLAEAERRPGELRGARINALELEKRLAFTGALELVLSAERIHELLPAAGRQSAAQFLPRRQPFALDGLLDAAPPGA